MTTSQMYDAAYPPSPAPVYPVVAFYIGGDTPHVWTDAEIADQGATYGLPIYVHDTTDTASASAASQIIAWLEAHQWEKGCAVAIDTEAVIETVWIEGVDAAVTAAGWPVIDYESKGPVPSNPETSGGRWIADWTGQPHLYAGSVATQYANSNQLGRPYDLSLIDLGVRLHQIHAQPAPPPSPTLEVEVQVPELREGATGAAVESCQALLVRHAFSVGPAGTDGIFGPDTLQAVRYFQQHAGITVDGIVGPVTWTRLVNG